jgi:hypothetical protein
LACRVEEIVAEFNKANMAELGVRLQRDKHMRSGSYGYPTAIECPESAVGILSPPPGSVAAFMARRNSGLVPRLKTAFEDGDQDALWAIRQELRADIPIRRVKFAEELYDLVQKSDVYFDFIYDRKLLAPEMCLFPENQHGVLVFPWNGGSIDSAAFKVLAYQRSGLTGQDKEFDFLVILRRPCMTNVERDLLSKVDMRYSELHLSPIVRCALIGPAITGIMSCLSIEDWSSDAMLRALNSVAVSEAEVATMTAPELARTLLHRRRTAMEINAP